VSLPPLLYPYWRQSWTERFSPADLTLHAPFLKG
jgi:hypothetical protein